MSEEEIKTEGETVSEEKGNKIVEQEPEGETTIDGPGTIKNIREAAAKAKKRKGFHGVFGQIGMVGKLMTDLVTSEHVRESVKDGIKKTGI